MIKKISLSVVAIFIVVLFTCQLISCGRSEQQDEKIELEDLSEADIAAINDSLIDVEVAANIFPATAARGDLWKAWEQSFASCYQNQTFKNPIYLGPSNAKYLGSILSKNLKTNKSQLLGKIDQEDYKVFTTFGSQVDQCDIKKVKDLSLGVFLSGKVLNSVDGDVRAALTQYDSVKFLGGSWQIDEIFEKDFKNYLDTTKNEKLKVYKEALLENNSVIITKIVKVNGFAAEIFSAKAYDAALKAKLATGVEVEVSKENPENGTPQLDVKFVSSTDKSVTVTSTGDFYVFALVKKVKRLGN